MSTLARLLAKLLLFKGVKKHTPDRHKFRQQRCWCGQHNVGGRHSPADIATAARWRWFNYADGRALSHQQRVTARETLQQHSCSGTAQLCHCKVRSIDTASVLVCSHPDTICNSLQMLAESTDHIATVLQITMPRYPLNSCAHNKST